MEDQNSLDFLTCVLQFSGILVLISQEGALDHLFRVGCATHRLFKGQVMWTPLLGRGWGSTGDKQLCFQEETRGWQGDTGHRSVSSRAQWLVLSSRPLSKKPGAGELPPGLQVAW